MLLLYLLYLQRMRAFRRIFSLLFLAILICATSCGRKRVEKIPSGIVVPDTMVKVLVDVHLLQASIQLGIGQDGQDTNTKAAFERIWKKHSMTEDKYNKSIEFYTLHPSVLDSIYDKVINTLSLQKAQLMGNKPR